MAAFIMSGPMQALGFVLMFAVLSLYLPYFGILGSLLSSSAIGLVTLRLGWPQGLKLTAMAGLALGAFTLLTQGSLLGLLAASLQWLPIVALASLLATTASWSYVLQALFGLAMLGVVLFHVGVADPYVFWENLINKMMASYPMQAPLAEMDIEEVLQTVAPYLVTFLAIAQGISMMIVLVLSRLWQAQLYNPGGFQEEWRQLRLHTAVGIAFSGLIALTVLYSTPLLISLIIVGLTMFLFQGLALVHGCIALLNVSAKWLLALYLPLLLMPIPMGLLLAVFGMVDTMADFRSYLTQRLTRK